MSLTIALQNTSDTDQTITLFDSGALGTASFIEVNSSFTAQSQVISSPSGASPSTQQVTNDGKIYYDAVFNPTTGYYFGTAGTILGFTATINGSPFSYITALPTVANRTFDDIQTFLTNQLRNNGTNPRPNAQVVLNVTQSNGINFLSALVLDIIESNESVVYNSLVLTATTTSLGVGASATPIFYDQAYTEAVLDNTFLLANYPSTTYADSDGWITFQGNSMSTPAFVWFRMYDTYLQSVSFASGYAYQFEFQLTEVLVGANFVLLNSPSGTNICTINGNSTAIQIFSGVVPNATRLILVSDNVASIDWSGQIKMRLRPMTGAQAPQAQPSLSLLSQINQGGAYLSSNPNIIGRVPVTGVGLQEILNSTTGNSYKVTSLYIWSANPTQLTQSVTYGIKDSNGDFEQTDLDIVIDPFAQNQVAYRTNGMDDFEIDSNSFIEFTLKAQSAVNMKFEYLKNSADEIKLIEMGLGKLLGLEEELKEEIDKSLIDDFDTFYAQQ
jgi:hypothetical protein